jgi:hypothetical protein
MPHAVPAHPACLMLAPISLLVPPGTADPSRSEDRPWLRLRPVSSHPPQRCTLHQAGEPQIAKVHRRGTCRRGRRLVPSPVGDAADAKAPRRLPQQGLEVSAPLRTCHTARINRVIVPPWADSWTSSRPGSWAASAVRAEIRIVRCIRPRGRIAARQGHSVTLSCLHVVTLSKLKGPPCHLGTLSPCHRLSLWPLSATSAAGTCPCNCSGCRRSARECLRRRSGRRSRRPRGRGQGSSRPS